MRVDIWSDIRCPFCYIGKRKFEKALESFEHRTSVEVVWHSFQLDPSLKTQPDVNTYDHLAAIKGISPEQSREMHAHITDVASQVGISFRFDKAVVANSFKAHRLIQLAKERGVANEAEEALFHAHFTEGKNIDDDETLVQVGKGIGIAEPDVRALLSSNDFSEAVEKDEALAREIGIRGVPFFIFNNRYAVSGAQSPDVFLKTLQKAWEEYALQPQK